MKSEHTLNRFGCRQYETLPPALQNEISRREYLWLDDADKDRLQDVETEPDEDVTE